MKKNFFEPVKKKPKVVNLVDEGVCDNQNRDKQRREVNSSGKGEKNVVKRGNKFGFNVSTMMDKVSSINNHKTFQNWRKVGKLTISYTYIIQMWKFDITNKSGEIWHFCPWGMRETISNKLKAVNCKAR